MNRIKVTPFKGIVLPLFLLAFMVVGNAGAVVVDLTAGEALPLTGAPSVPVWGFGLNGGPIKVPGDPIVVPPEDTTLTINLTNNLSEPVSLQILGQMLSPNSGPVWTDAAGGTIIGSRPGGDFTARVRSFSHETAPAATVSYTWINFKPGTYLLTSATNPAKQVQMGLYAAVKQDVASGEAYSGVSYDKELILVYHEVDPAINAAIDAGNYGAGADPMTGGITSSIRREPTYFLINGLAYPDAGLEQVLFADPYDRVLLRFINAGYNTHVPQLLNMFMTTVAEDGRPYAYPKEQYGYELAAGKTMDAVIQPMTDGHFSIHDAMLNLSNPGSEEVGGMLAYYDVGCAGDLNDDSAVNFLDLGLFRSDFPRTDCHDPGIECVGDINNDGAVNFLDLGLFRSDFPRTGCPQPVP